MTNKNVLLIGSKNPGSKNDIQVLASRLGLENILTCFLEDLMFFISNQEQKIIDTVTGEDIANADLVICMNWYKQSKLLPYKDMGFTIALYLESKGVTYWNREMRDQRSTTKLSAMMQLALNGLAVPATIFAANSSRLEAALPGDFPMVVKAVAGSRGVNNFLVKNQIELEKVLASHGDIAFMIQEFLPNDYDLRVVCADSKPVLVIKRSRAGQYTHLNNTSQGAAAEIVELSQVDPDVIAAATKACKVMRRDIAGVDFIIANDRSQRMVCLEVNALPQLTSGTYLTEKAEALTQAIKEAIKEIS